MRQRASPLPSLNFSSCMRFIDTVGLSLQLDRMQWHRARDAQIGWKKLAANGDSFKYVANKGVQDPCLTLLPGWNQAKFLRVEFSPSTILTGSNLILSSYEDVDAAFDKVATFVESRLPINFDPTTCDVYRVDFAKDFKIARDKVKAVVRNFWNVELPKYRREAHNDETVYFKPCGTQSNSCIRIYDKLTQIGSKGVPLAWVSTSSGILRVERSYKTTRAVSALMRELDLPDRKPSSILNNGVGGEVLHETLRLLDFGNVVRVERDDVEILKFLISQFGDRRGAQLFGQLACRKHFGDLWATALGCNPSNSTKKRDRNDLRSVGIYSLEE